MIYAKFNEDGYIIEFTTQEKDGYMKVKNLNCRLVNGNIVDETEKFLNQDKIRELENWFNTYFRMQLEQHSWQKDYKPSEDPYFINDDGTHRTYSTFEEVIEQAEIVREEIKKLKENKEV